MTVVAEVFTRHELGGEQDLAGMSREMLDDVVDRFHDGHCVLLNGRLPGQLIVRQSSYDCDGVVDAFVEAAQQSPFILAPPGGEFRAALANVGLTADAIAAPLPDVSC